MLRLQAVALLLCASSFADGRWGGPRSDPQPKPSCGTITFEIENRSVVGFERDGKILLVYAEGKPLRIRYLEVLTAGSGPAKK